MNKKDNLGLRFLLWLICSCAVVGGVYFYLVSLNKYELTYGVMIAYIVLFFVCLLSYALINKGILGFSKITPDMISNTVPEEQKKALADRMNTIKVNTIPLLTLAIAFILVFLLDYLGVQDIVNKLWN